jgi:hypothetical protein
MIRLGVSPVFHFRDRYFGCPGKQRRQMAGASLIEVLNHNEREPGIARKMVEQLRECLQPPG